MAKLVTRNPFTLKTGKSYVLDTLTQAKKKAARSRVAFESWRKVSLSDRVDYVEDALKYFETNKDQIAKDITEQMGKPLNQSYNELNGFFERANYLCQVAESVLKTEEIAPKENFYRAIAHEPLGVVFVVSAWNYPLLISVNSVVAALLAGNTVLLKHSSSTPAVGKHFENAFKKMGKNDDLVLNLTLDHSVTGKLIETCPEIAHVVFTGSVGGGKTIQKHASKQFLGLNLELGGKDAAFVDQDVNLEHAAATIVDGAMYNAGQSCCGIERVYVHQAVYKEFLKEVLKIVDTYKLGDPMKSGTMMGPLAQASGAKEMLAQVQDAKKKGAKVLRGGKVKKVGKATFFEPTVITNVSHKMKVMREENFGPILPIMKVRSEAEAIKLINDSDFGLTGAIFTENQTNALRFADQVNTGTVFMNRCDYLDPALPWTGVKDSGMGSALSQYGFYGLTRRKSIHFRVSTGKN